MNISWGPSEGRYYVPRDGTYSEISVHVGRDLSRQYVIGEFTYHYVDFQYVLVGISCIEREPLVDYWEAVEAARAEVPKRQAAAWQSARGRGICDWDYD